MGRDGDNLVEKALASREQTMEGSKNLSITNWVFWPLFILGAVFSYFIYANGGEFGTIIALISLVVFSVCTLLIIYGIKSFITEEIEIVPFISLLIARVDNTWELRVTGLAARFLALFLIVTVLTTYGYMVYVILSAFL